jgi:hypothetical protein
MPKKEVPDTKLIARVPKSLLVRFKGECVKRGVTMQSATVEALKAWLKRRAG